MFGIETVNNKTARRATFWAHLVRSSPYFLLLLNNGIIQILPIFYVVLEIWFIIKHEFTYRFIDIIAKTRVQRTNTRFI